MSRGGLAAGLFTPDRRYLGILGLNTDTAEHPTEAARDLIGALAPTIARAIDPMRAIGAAARIIRNAQAAVVLTRAGHTLPLDGLPRHRLLAPGSPVLAVAADHLADNVEFATFLCPDDERRLARITTLSCARQPARHLAGEPFALGCAVDGAARFAVLSGIGSRCTPATESTVVTVATFFSLKLTVISRAVT